MMRVSAEAKGLALTGRVAESVPAVCEAMRDGCGRFS
jgi:hypothetical protein